MKPVAQIAKLSVAFETPSRTVQVLDDLSFSLTPGKTMVLLGESGCGKSLTSLALMRLLPPYGVYGHASQVDISHTDILNLPERVMQALRGKKLAMVFQEPMSALNPVLTIGEQLAEVLQKEGVYTSKALQERMCALLREVELPEPEKKIRQYPHQLSGGQKQRVVIAMAIALNPEILIADEPTTALDVTIQAQILTLLKKLQSQHGMSLLLITHDLGVVKAMADEVCVMYAGQIVEQASVNDFFTQARHPYSQQLLHSVPSLHKKHDRLSIIAGSVPSMDDLPTGCRFHPRCHYAFSTCSQTTPPLMTLDKRQVRCHLYPQQAELPPWVSETEAWPEHNNQTQEVLKVEGLSVEYVDRGGFLGRSKSVFKAVDGLSFTLHKGKTLALVGESGCGKTTASRAIMRLLPAASGAVWFHDKPVLTLKGTALKAYRNQVQMIFQDPYAAMNPRLTIADIISEGMRAQGMSKSIIQKRLYELLDQVNLPKTSLQRYPHQFSGGQRQRIGIARALATKPEIIICDEPTSALDVSVQAQILNLLKTLQLELGLSYLFITHNMGVVSYLADEVLVMKAGKVVEHAATEVLFGCPEMEYTRELIASVPDF